MKSIIFSTVAVLAVFSTNAGASTEAKRAKFIPKVLPCEAQKMASRQGLFPSNQSVAQAVSSSKKSSGTIR